MLTASAMFRRDFDELMREKYEIFNCRLTLGDTTAWLGLASLGEFWWDSRETIVYRRHPGGITQGGRAVLVGLDAALVRLFYENAVLGIPMWQSKHIYRVLDCRLRYKAKDSFLQRVREAFRVSLAFSRCLWFYHLATWIGLLLFLSGREKLGPFSGRTFIGFAGRLHHIPHFIWWWISGRDAQVRMF